MCSPNQPSSEGCGLGGRCVDGLCVCEKGWKKSSEFSFFTQSDSTESSDFLCDSHAFTLQLLYSLALITLILGAVLYALSAKKKSQQKRLIPYYFMTLVAAAFCVLKLFDPEKSITDDIVQAIFFGLSMFFAVVTSIVLVTKYIAFRFKVDLLYNPKFIKTIKFLQISGYISITVEFVALCMFISIPFFPEDSRMNAKIIMKIGFFLSSMSTLFGVSSTFTVVNTLIKMMKQTLPASECELPIKAMRRTRNLVMMSGSQTTFFFFFAAVSDTWLRLEKYFVPTATFLFALLSIGILYSTLAHKKQIKTKQYISTRKRPTGKLSTQSFSTQNISAQNIRDQLVEDL